MKPCMVPLCSLLIVLQEIMIPDLVKIGVADTFQTGARRLWKAIFESSKKAGEFEVFDMFVPARLLVRKTSC